jgi:hypothetical protein
MPENVVERLRADLALADVDKPFKDDPAMYLSREDCTGIAAAYRVVRQVPALLAVVEAAKAFFDPGTTNEKIDAVNDALDRLYAEEITP